jgi:arylsulfatase
MQDLLPTLLDLAGLSEAGGTLPGLDLAPMLRQGSEPDARPVFFERPYYSPESIRAGRAEAQGGFGELASVVLGKDKLIRLPPDAVTQAVEQRLYDLASDPDELHDIAAEHPELVQKLSALLDEWLARYPVDESAAAPVLTPERQADLERLGYMGGGGGEPENDPPKDPQAPGSTSPRDGGH